jgi:hypothetical protein
MVMGDTSTFMVLIADRRIRRTGFRWNSRPGSIM